MIYPMMMAVDFSVRCRKSERTLCHMGSELVDQTVQHVRHFRVFFFFVVFKNFITPELATIILAGAILLSCILYSDGVCLESIDKRQSVYTVVQVATNDLIILVALYSDRQIFIGRQQCDGAWDTLILSVVLFVVIPLVGGVLTRIFVTKKKGVTYFEKDFRNLMAQLQRGCC